MMLRVASKAALHACLLQRSTHTSPHLFLQLRGEVEATRKVREALSQWLTAKERAQPKSVHLKQASRVLPVLLQQEPL
jgi:hypothetical protein